MPLPKDSYFNSIISSMFFGWCAEIAHEFGLFHAIFIAGGGFGFACYYSLWLNLPHSNSDSDELELPDFPEASTLHVTQMSDTLIVADGTRALSFGSQNTISSSQMMQLAMALEACGKNFIWVVRPPIGFDINSEFKANEWLPEGFEERIRDSGRGLVVHTWATQVGDFIPQIFICIFESLWMELCA
ncbi:hypothetical protein Pint_31211 [Pistacia integerrima]|uniref:Uncharacterized protein n=2 Tax=Pistacia integerrima TaxID=434235 RepID=A0ACC0XQQ5_9ROSI|nr:hypothetical protein Pint_31202 [Pistacia integerrima]KAJ0021727.1 hypothetical protein Pint_31211 [Pistacia integerrima]